MDAFRKYFRTMYGMLMVYMWVIPLIITLFCVLVIVCACTYMGKYHNPIEHVASEIIEHEIGVNIDELLPPDEPETKKVK